MMANEAMDEATLTKIKKFAFDMHNFDNEEYVDPKAEQEPPAPTFSEEELEAARQDGFAKGKQEGLAEAKASRDQEILQILKTITEQTVPFLEAENAREKIYELESVKLCHQVFQKLFPRLQEKHGFEELTAIISDVLTKNQGQSKIMLEVHPDAKAAVEEHLKTLTPNIEFDIKGNESFLPMSCELKWNDGGAVYHAGTLADQILNLMEEALAARGGSLHDSEEDSKKAVSEDAPAKEEPKEVKDRAEEIKEADEAQSSDTPEEEMETDNDG